MPAVFQQAGVQFEYPDNWKIEELDESNDKLQVVIASPSTVFWQLSKHPAGTEPERLFDEALAALRSEYKKIEVEPAQDQTEKHELTGFDVSFFCFDLTTTCWLRTYESSAATFLWLCQAEDRDFSQVAPVFRAMLASTLRNLP